MKTFITVIILLFPLMSCDKILRGELSHPTDQPFGTAITQSQKIMTVNARQVDPIITKVYFEFDKDELSSASKKKLDQAAQVINKRKGKVIVEGHTDHINTENYNKLLGFKRAIQVARYLESAGVWDERIIIHGFGEDRPQSTNWSDIGRASNRRVIVKMFPQGEGIKGEEAEIIYSQMMSKQQANRTQFNMLPENDFY